jgi:phosphate:Na+ symporter
MERCASELRTLRQAHAGDMLKRVAGGTIGAEEAAARVDAVRRMEALAHHAWQCASHLVAGD